MTNSLSYTDFVALYTIPIYIRSSFAAVIITMATRGCRRTTNTQTVRALIRCFHSQPACLFSLWGRPENIGIGIKTENRIRTQCHSQTDLCIFLQGVIWNNNPMLFKLYVAAKDLFAQLNNKLIIFQNVLLEVLFPCCDPSSTIGFHAPKMIEGPAFLLHCHRVAGTGATT